LNAEHTIMATYTVRFEPAGVAVRVDPAAYPYGHHGLPGSVLDIALAHGVDIEHTCGGVGACSTCHVIVEDGGDNLSQAADEELDRVELAPGNTVRSRLACQAVVRGDVTVRVPDWNRNVAKESG
jgi:ferredoxin, 2Fe-2S